jgi:hypothetical protein
VHVVVSQETPHLRQHARHSGIFCDVESIEELYSRMIDTHIYILGQKQGTVIHPRIHVLRTIASDGSYGSRVACVGHGFTRDTAAAAHSLWHSNIFRDVEQFGTPVTVGSGPELQ